MNRMKGGGMRKKGERRRKKERKGKERNGTGIGLDWIGVGSEESGLISGIVISDMENTPLFRVETEGREIYE